MMTVLIKHRDTGRDVLLSAKSVEFEHSVFPDRPGTGLLVNFDGETSQHFALSEKVDDARDVFVMNAAGQTVARYTL